MKIFLARLKIGLGISLTKSDHDCLFINTITKDRRFKVVARSRERVSFLFNEKIQLHARLYPHSDLAVLEQVFIKEEYKLVTSFLAENFSQNKTCTIIDAGTNVGYTALFFLDKLKDSSIVCIEPDTGNSGMAKENLAPYIQQQKAIVYQKALLAEDGKSLVTKNDFRDGKDWGVYVEESAEETSLKSISIGQILEDKKWNVLDLLKIDIEGAERFVFAPGADVSYLEKIKMLAIEIHDEFNVRNEIYALLNKAGFLILDFAETTFFINKRFIQ